MEEELTLAQIELFAAVERECIESHAKDAILAPGDDYKGPSRKPPLEVLVCLHYP